MSAGFPNQSSFAPSPFEQPPRRSGGNWLLSLLLIGLGFLFLGGVVCVAGVWYVASNLETWVVGLGREAIVAGINDSDLPEEEKKEVITQVDRVVVAYKEGKLTQADLERVLTDLEDSPALKALTLYGIENEFLEGSNLNEQELAQARTTFNRVLRGVYEGKISDETFWNAWPNDEGEPVNLASTNANEDANDDELRLTIAKLKVLADNARVSDEPFKLDIGDEVKKLVDQALAGK
jgi:hypothetical protein